ncbi:MAG TPA: hypothetical protein VFL84_12100 [Gammaproteobacteria bacterium]|nr:hypothetical protein [Gammaproteobacteria bacterium]
MKRAQMDKANGFARSARACAAVLAAALAAPVAAQQSADASAADDAADGPQACLNQNEIRRATILNDRNIVFTTRHDVIYSNQLPKQCPGLNRKSIVNYPITNRRLCAGDRFQVLWEQAPGRFAPAAMCPLGTFVPITATELEDLASSTDDNRGRRQRGRSAREAVTTEQVELPPAATPPEAAAPTAPE